MPVGEHVLYSGVLKGDAFPNAEVFVARLGMEPTMLNTFETQGGQYTGSATLLVGKNYRDMGTFSGAD